MRRPRPARERERQREFGAALFRRATAPNLGGNPPTRRRCPDAPDGPLPYNFCALLGGDARPLSAPLPQFLLMKSGRPVQRLYQRLSADGLRAATFGARGSPLPPRSGPERACSVEAISAALFLADNAQLHECSVKEHLGDRFVKFAAGAASGSIESNFNDRIAALGVVVVGGGLCVAVLAALNTFAHDYPATVSLAVNVVSSVAIIFVNKTIYLRGFNYGACGGCFCCSAWGTSAVLPSGLCAAIMRDAHILALRAAAFPPLPQLLRPAVITLGGIHFLATSSVRLCAQKQSPKDGDISYRGAPAARSPSPRLLSPPPTPHTARNAAASPHRLPQNKTPPPEQSAHRRPGAFHPAQHGVPQHFEPVSLFQQRRVLPGAGGLLGPQAPPPALPAPRPPRPPCPPRPPRPFAWPRPHARARI